MDYFTSDPFSSRVEGLIRQNRVPGLAIAVVQGDRVAAAGYGHACVGTNQVCTADTLFDVGSSAKSLTAACVALLVEDDAAFPDIQYESVMSELLPDFVMCDDTYTKGITIDDVLGHRTGFPGHNDSCLGVRAGQPDNARSITRNLRNLAVAAPLRSKYIYSNIMYTVATHLVEEKSKQSFADFLSERLFQPLGMISSCLQPGQAREKGLVDRMATGYFWNKSLSLFTSIPSQDCPEGQGAGSVISSANEFIKWIKALINREGPISEAVYAGLTRMRTFRNPNTNRLNLMTSPSFYAAGLEMYYYRGHAVIWHNGNVPGFASRFFFIPDFQFGAVILGNSAGAASVASLLSKELIDKVLKVAQCEESVPSKYNIEGTVVPVQGQKSEADGEGQRKAAEKTSKKNKNKKAKGDRKTPAASEEDGTQENATGERAMAIQQQETPLETYTGDYWNPGYRGMGVEIKEGKLFIDATDRSMPFTLTMPLSSQTHCTAYLCDLWEGGNDPVATEFVFQDGKVVKMGLDLEPVLREKIWFDKSG